MLTDKSTDNQINKMYIYIMVQYLAHATAQMNFFNITLGGKSQSQRTNIVCFYLYEMFTMGNFIVRNYISGCQRLGWKEREWGVTANGFKSPFKDD